MKINFSELLASERVRPLWGRSFTQESAQDELEQLLQAHNLPSLAPGAASPHGPSLPGASSGLGAAPTAGAAAGPATDPSLNRTSAAGERGDPQVPPAGPVGAGQAAQHTTVRPGSQGTDADPAPPDLADLPIRPPHEIFADLERAVQGDLGTRATMVRNFIEALRVRVHAVDPTADAALYHPMRHAAGGTLFELLHRMEDTLSGLRRVAAGR